MKSVCAASHCKVVEGKDVSCSEANVKTCGEIKISTFKNQAWLRVVFFFLVFFPSSRTGVHGLSHLTLITPLHIMVGKNRNGWYIYKFKSLETKLVSHHSTRNGLFTLCIEANITCLCSVGFWLHINTCVCLSDIFVLFVFYWVS